MSKFRLVAPFMIVMLVLTACPAGDDRRRTGARSRRQRGGGSTATHRGNVPVGRRRGGGLPAVLDGVHRGDRHRGRVHAGPAGLRRPCSTTRIAEGDPPDVAIIPGIGFLRSFARRRLLIVPLADLGIDDAFLESAYARTWRRSACRRRRRWTARLYALMVKLNSKAPSGISPELFAERRRTSRPSDWDDFLALTEQINADGGTPWSLGAGDSWTLTDWFESIYIRQAGVKRTTRSSAPRATGRIRASRPRSTPCSRS